MKQVFSPVLLLLFSRGFKCLLIDSSWGSNTARYAVLQVVAAYRYTGHCLVKIVGTVAALIDSDCFKPHYETVF